MRPLEITIGISPADLAPWNGAEVPVRFIITETMIHVEYDPPPKNQSFMDQLQKEFTKIEPYITGQSLDIMRFFLEIPTGKTSRKSLIKHIWNDYIPTQGRVRNAICILNKRLEQLEFGYVVRCNRTGMIEIVLRR